MSEKRLPLAGVRVVELATFIAAATAGRFLADLGADVIKIETAKGDVFRYTGPSVGCVSTMEESTLWELENANKRGLSLNTKTPEGMEALFKLLETADVFITNWRIQALERSGLDYESLKKRFPKLVYAICTGYGEHGPDKDLPGFDYTSFFARGGYLEGLRQADGKPMNVVPGLGDHNVGMNLAAGILAALYQAKVTGKGEKVETSLYETAVFNLGLKIQAAQYEGVGPTYPVKARDCANPCLNCYPTKDGRYIQLCFPDYNVYFKAFAACLGKPELGEDERYYPVQNLQAKGLVGEMYDIITEAFQTKDAAEWVEILTKNDIPFALAKNWNEILVDPQAWENDCFYKMTFPNGVERTLVRLPVRFQEMGTPDYRPGPKVGEQGEAIMKELGYTQEQVDAMRASGTLFVWGDKK